jgi:hypothetical protein
MVIAFSHTRQMKVCVEMAWWRVGKSVTVVMKRRVQSWSLGTAVISKPASWERTLCAVPRMVNVALLLNSTHVCNS